ncbi:hypothetical protein BDV11DRAFT_73926 [Aspergillus similis]
MKILLIKSRFRCLFKFFFFLFFYGRGWTKHSRPLSMQRDDLDPQFTQVLLSEVMDLTQPEESLGTRRESFAFYVWSLGYYSRSGGSDVWMHIFSLAKQCPRRIGILNRDESRFQL